MRLRPVHVLPVALVAAALAGCGGGDGDSTGGGATAPPATTQSGGGQATQTTPAEGPDGAAVFASAGCASCHTLAAADAHGSIGPNLDDLKLTASVVRAQVENGGGGMPAFGGDLSPEEIDAVSAFVAENAGR